MLRIPLTAVPVETEAINGRTRPMRVNLVTGEEEAPATIDPAA